MEYSTIQALTGIDCEAAKITTLEFSFTVNGSPHGPYRYTCREHQADIKGLPAGTGIQVDVYAYDENHAAVLYGSEITDIHAGQVTEGGKVEMNYVDENQDRDGDGFSAQADCDDNNADINPDAAEIPDNDVDENCDGRTEVSAFTINDLEMEFVRIPAGEFNMGTPLEQQGHADNESLHRVRLTRDFYLQTAEVTQRQWRMVVNAAANPSLDPNPSYFINCGDDCPVEQVSWEDVQLFIDTLNIRYEGTYEFRLPTEAQWEYAARAGSDTAFADGPITEIDCGIDPVLEAMGWYCGNADVNYNGCNEFGSACYGPHPVAEKNPNAWDIYDMHGNLYEWCQDYYEDTYSYATEPVIDPQGPNIGMTRVLRGGSWSQRSARCRSAHRFRSTPGSRGDEYGFRLVCSQLSN